MGMRVNRDGAAPSRFLAHEGAHRRGRGGTRFHARNAAQLTKCGSCSYLCRGSVPHRRPLAGWPSRPTFGCPFHGTTAQRVGVGRNGVAGDHRHAVRLPHVLCHRSLRQGTLCGRPPVSPHWGDVGQAQPVVAVRDHGRLHSRPAPPLRRRLQPRVVRRHLPHLAPAVGDEVVVEGDDVQDPAAWDG